MTLPVRDSDTTRGPWDFLDQVKRPNITSEAWREALAKILKNTINENIVTPTSTTESTTTTTLATTTTITSAITTTEEMIETTSKSIMKCSKNKSRCSCYEIYT